MVILVLSTALIFVSDARIEHEADKTTPLDKAMYICGQHTAPPGTARPGRGATFDPKWAICYKIKDMWAEEIRRKEEKEDSQQRQKDRRDLDYLKSVAH